MYSVIIVEDDPMVASINRQYVELEPSFSVKQSFKSGQDALSWLSREEADLIILDYYMPLMTGKEFIDRLLSHMQPSSSSFQTELAKGLSETTLNLIRNFLQNRPGEFFSSEQIAEQVCLSRITIRRYVNYMLEMGEIISSVDYQTGGRPSIKYTCSCHVL